jgi:hypothetical protein
VLPLARTTSDHLPCKIQIGADIPKANIFRFENYWFNHPSCLEHISNFGSLVDYGLALLRVKFRLSAEVILVKINFKNSKMM